MFRHLSLRQQQRLVIVTFLAVPLLLLFTFTYYPATQLFYFSLTDWDGYAPQKTLVGLNNYVDLFEDPEQLHPLWVSIYYFVGAVVQLILALWFAVLVNSKLIGRNLFKTLIFIPFVLNSVAASMVFQIFYQVDGALDSFLEFVGLGSLIHRWLEDADIVNWALAAASVWRYLGYVPKQTLKL